MIKVSTDNITSASAYGTSLIGTIYGFIEKIDWLTIVSVLLSFIVAMTNLYYQRRKTLAEIKQIEHEIKNKDDASRESMEFLKEKRRLELKKLEKDLL